MNAILRWEDPPPEQTGRHKHRRFDHPSIAAELRAQPGRWGLIFVGSRASRLATSITNGVLAAYRPAGDFEAVSRIRPDGRDAVYVRYLGDGGLP